MTKLMTIFILFFVASIHAQDDDMSSLETTITEDVQIPQEEAPAPESNRWNSRS